MAHEFTGPDGEHDLGHQHEGGGDGLTEFCHAHAVSEGTVLAVEAAFAQLEKVLALRHSLPVETIAAIREMISGASRTGALGGRGNVDAARAVEAKCRRGFHLLLAYQDKQRPKSLRPKMGGTYSKAEVEALTLEVFTEAQMSTRAMALELGFTTAAGGDEPAKIARRFGYEKFTFCKCAEKFQQALELPLRPGQRDEAARGNMAEARKGQLKGKT